MQLRPGLKLRSAVCSTEVIVVSAAGGDVDLTCGGVGMSETAVDQPAEAIASLTGGTLLGKRYCDDEGAIEVLCTKPGNGSLGIGQTPLALKESKPLPASD